jgi:hypothetical protein
MYYTSNIYFFFHLASFTLISSAYIPKTLYEILREAMQEEMKSLHKK